jgi:S1-C subfamily serine protease
MAGHWLRYSATLLLCGGVFMGFVAAQTDDGKKTPPSLLQVPRPIQKNATPTSVDELRAMEQYTQTIIEKVMPAVVCVRVGPGQGSGVIVDDEGHILTAGHVSGKPGQTAFIVLSDGMTLKAKTLGQYKSIDSGMVQIDLNLKENKDKLKDKKLQHLEMGKSSELVKGQWVLGIGHPGGFRANRTPVVRVGRILHTDTFVIQSDCTLVGGDSGGPLFDMHGRVIGIHSRIGGFTITENMHVPVDTFRTTWDKLARGESWGEGLGKLATVRSAGGKIVFEKKDALVKDNDAVIPSPKDKTKDAYFKEYTFRMKAGHTYTLDLISGDKTGKKLDPYLRLESPDGKLIAEDDDGGGFPNSRIVHKALKDADCRIVATSFEPDQTGPFTLKISDADFIDALVTGNVEVLKAIKLPTPAVGKLVNDFAKKKTPLHINAILLDDSGNPQPNKELVLKWEKGTQTLKSDKNGVVRWLLASDKSRQLAFQLPQGTRAMLALTDSDGIGLKYIDGDPTVEKIKSAGGAVVRTFDGNLTDRDPFDRERTKSRAQVHEFQFKAGKTYTLDLMSDDFDAYLRIEDESKAKLAEDNDGAGNLNARVVFTPKEDGIYRLAVTTFEAAQTGAYRLTVRETNAVPVELKQEDKKVEKN